MKNSRTMFQSKFVFFLILIHLTKEYNNFNELKHDMENRVQKIAVAMEQIMSQKCVINTYECPVKSFNLCQGTGPRDCLIHFPPSSTCNGLNKYSTVSGIRVPNSYASFNLSQQTKFFICKTAEPQLQSVFQQLIQSNEQTYAWLNFGFVDGTHRVSPGFKFKKQKNLQSCENYDPRGRPWYATNAFNRKKMIVLVQNSKRIHQLPNRFHSIQLSLAALLKTSQQGDYFNIIQFSDSPRLLINEKDMKLVSLIDQTTKWDEKTKTTDGYYKALASNISKSMSTITNYTRAFNMAVEILNNSRYENSDYENFILMFSGFQPAYFNVNEAGESEYELFLKKKQKQLNMSFIFFGFGVDMVNQRGKDLLKNMSCKFDGIFFEISDIKYETMFLDQARGYYEYLSQGNQIQGYRWTNFYDDQFYLGRMTTVVRAAYYKQKNVTRLIGLASLDVLVSQMTIYKTEEEIKKQLQVTERPFKRNISLCALQTIRRKHRCFTVQQSQCDYYEYCEPKLTPSNDSVMSAPYDATNENCCPLQVQTMTGLIVGVSIGGFCILILLILLIYCCMCKKRSETKLQETYSEIFSKFKDFDQTRVRTDSDISLIKE